MQDDIGRLLECEIETLFRNVDLHESGSDKHREIIREIETLYNLRLEERRIEKEFEEKEKRRILDAEQMAENDHNAGKELTLKNKQFDQDVVIGYIRTGVELAAVVFPLVFYATWMKRGFKFEESGSFTSNTFRSLFSKFRTTK